MLASALVAWTVFASRAASADDDVSRPGAEPPTAPTAASRTTYGGLVSGGASYRQLFGLPVEAADVGLGLGLDSDHLALYVRADFEAGRTDHGLTTRVYRVGVSAEGVVGRFRLGMGIDMLGISVRRVTDHTTLDELGVGVFALGSLDVVRFAAHALYLGVRVDADWVDGTGVVGTSVALGFRL